VQANLPTVPLYEITLHPRDNDMILATHGRSIWILDDLAPFQQFGRAGATDVFVFPTPPATTRNGAADRMRSFEGNRQFLGVNPQPGAALTYYLKSGAKDVRWTISDASGVVVRELSGDATRAKGAAGVNTVTWDLRVAPLKPLRGQQPGGGGGFFGGGLNGPFVMPGTYKATLTLDGKEAGATDIRVQDDPAVSISDADRKTQFDTALSLHGLQERAIQAADTLNALDEQTRGIQDKLKEAADVPESVSKPMAELAKRIGDLKPKLGLVALGQGGFGAFQQNVRGRIGFLKGAIMGSTSLPTETQSRQAREVAGELDKVIGEVNEAIAAATPVFREVAAKGLVPAVPAPVK
jgi:hypothetical protein